MVARTSEPEGSTCGWNTECGSKDPVLGVDESLPVQQMAGGGLVALGLAVSVVASAWRRRARA